MRLYREALRQAVLPTPTSLLSLDLISLGCSVNIKHLFPFCRIYSGALLAAGLLRKPHAFAVVECGSDLLSLYRTSFSPCRR